MDRKFLVILVICYFIYLFIGGAIFTAIEGPGEEQQCSKTKSNIKDMLDEVVLKNNTVSLKTVINITRMLRAAAAYGIVIDDDFNVSCSHNWNFESAFFFSGTVVTTIGYGNISPKTRLGRSVCILYAIIGIPVFGVMFGALGESISRRIDKLHGRLRGKAKRTWVAKGVVILIVMGTFLVFCMIIPASIFKSVENWSYSDSFYYAFITLTTIGFGDFVAGTNPEIDYIHVYRVMVYFWILFGMAFMATLVSLTSEFFRKTGQRIHICDRIGQHKAREKCTDGDWSRKGFLAGRKARERATGRTTEEDGKVGETGETRSDVTKDNMHEAEKRGSKEALEVTNMKENFVEPTESNESLEKRPLNIQQFDYDKDAASDQLKAAGE